MSAHVKFRQVIRATQCFVRECIMHLLHACRYTIILSEAEVNMVVEACNVESEKKTESTLTTSESKDLEEDSQLEDFELLKCDVCDKYFVSQESLSAHKSQCIFLVKTELPVPQIENSITELQETFPGISFVPKVRTL